MAVATLRAAERSIRAAMLPPVSRDGRGMLAEVRRRCPGRPAVGLIWREGRDRTLKQRSVVKIRKRAHIGIVADSQYKRRLQLQALCHVAIQDLQDGSQQLGVRAHSHSGNGSERGCDNLLYCLDCIAVRGEMRDADPVAWAGPRVPCMLPGACELDIYETGTTWPHLHIGAFGVREAVRCAEAGRRLQAHSLLLPPPCNQNPTSPKHKAPQART
eukprot:scaffold8641_cov134-Isochrysis_galbana.AAC.13